MRCLSIYRHRGDDRQFEDQPCGEEQAMVRVSIPQNMVPAIYNLHLPPIRGAMPYEIVVNIGEKSIFNLRLIKYTVLLAIIVVAT